MKLPRIRVPSFRGRKLPGSRGIALIAIGAFVVGVGAGWFTSVVTAALVRVEPSPTPSPTASPSPSTSGGLDIPVNPYPPIERKVDAADNFAGLTGLVIPSEGSGTYAIAAGVVEPPGDGPVRWVRIEVEDGLPVSPDAAAIFVLGVLNDDRGWGANGRMSFGRTDGAADFSVVFASPGSMAHLCSDPHRPAPQNIDDSDPVPDVSGGGPSATTVATLAPSASPSASPEALYCAEEGIVVINTYWWAAGLKSYGVERQSARQYLINHFVGHVLQTADTTCPGADQLAPVMEDQELPLGECRPNPWPHPASE